MVWREEREEREVDRMESWKNPWVGEGYFGYFTGATYSEAVIEREGWKDGGGGLVLYGGD